MTDAKPLEVMPVRIGLSGAELEQFNSHLAALATAGLPLEQGIRLAASEARSGRVRRELNALAADLEAGVSLSEAFGRRRGAFPSMYAALMESAVATGNLPALLLSLGRHQRTSEQLKAAVAKSLSYPLTLLAGVCVVTAVVSALILPQIRQVYKLVPQEDMFGFARGWGRAPAPTPTTFPFVSDAVLAIGPYLPFVAGAILVLVLLVPLAIPVLRRCGWDAAWADWLCGVPLIGPAVRFSALARFADALAVAVRAPLNLPQALRLAGGAVGYPRLIADAEGMAGALESGRSVSGLKGRMLPAALAETIAAASASASLPESLEALALLYRQQSELRAQRIPLVLLPAALLFVGCIVGLLVAAIMLPLSHMLRSLL